MPESIAYLYYNATAPVHDAAKAAMRGALDLVGNPSSVHGPGRAARKALEDARETLAQAVGVTPAQVIFTSGGSEANVLALMQVSTEHRLASAIEHASVLAQVPAAQHVPVSGAGQLDLAALEARLAGNGGGALVAVMAANNETGVIQPVAAAAHIAKAHGARLHVDAVQMLGKAPLDFTLLGASMAVSAHKIGGPKGVGALIVRDGLALAPMLGGGGQEMRRRGGTENLPGILGFAAAVKAIAALGDWTAPVRRLRDALEAEIAAIAPDAIIIGAAAERLATTSAIAMPGVEAQTQLMALDLAGVAVSAGSACSSGKTAPSHVLRAMGVAEAVAGATVRVSLGWGTRESDIARFVDAWRALYRRARRRSA
jgi:cysteine desulfurase